MAATPSSPPPPLGNGPFYSIDVECVVRAPASTHVHGMSARRACADAASQATGTDHNARAVAQISLVNQARPNAAPIPWVALTVRTGVKPPSRTVRHRRWSNRC